jgi:hypothetical protein
MLILAVTLNDNTILEYLLHDDVFPGILGVLECKLQDPDELPVLILQTIQKSPRTRHRTANSFRKPQNTAK